jgi:ribosomal protein S20
MSTMSKVILSGSTIAEVTSALKSQETTDKKWVKACDALRSDRVNSAMLETAKKGGDEDVRTQVKSLIVTTFTEGERALLALDSKSLPKRSDQVQGDKAHSKEDKKAVQGKIGARLTLIQYHIRKAEKAEEDGEAEAPKTAVQRVHADLDKAIAKLQKLEGATFEVAEVVKRINTAKGMMPAL